MSNQLNNLSQYGIQDNSHNSLSGNVPLNYNLQSQHINFSNSFYGQNFNSLQADNRSTNSQMQNQPQSYIVQNINKPTMFSESRNEIELSMM